MDQKDLHNTENKKPEAFLENLKRQNVFHTPDAYFESFPLEMMRQIKELPSDIPAEKSATKRIWWNSIAAAIAMLIVFGLSLQFSLSRQHRLTIEELSSADILAGLDAYDLDDAAIVQYFEAADLLNFEESQELYHGSIDQLLESELNQDSWELEDFDFDNMDTDLIIQKLVEDE